MLSRLIGAHDAGLSPAADRMLSFFRLDHLADEEAGGLSYGQQKLLDAAMAFMAGPRLPLVDRPAGARPTTPLPTPLPPSPGSLPLGWARSPPSPPHPRAPELFA